MRRIEDQTPQAKQLLEMESYGTIDERSAATPPKLGRGIIAAVAAVALVVGALAALSVNRLPGANLITTLTPDAGAVDFVKCTTQWDPDGDGVCGADGKTYGNACLAAAQGVEVVSQRACSGNRIICLPCPPCYCSGPPES